MSVQECVSERPLYSACMSVTRIDGEMKKFYLHLRVEVFFGLSCKNLPFRPFFARLGGGVECATAAGTWTFENKDMRVEM